MDRRPRDDHPIPAVVTNDEPRTIAPMNPDTPMRFVLAAALIADAIAGHLLYSNAFATPNGRQAVLGATALAVLVAGVAVAVVRKPSELALSLARGIAVVMIVGLAGVGLLFLLAANFEGGHDLRRRAIHGRAWARRGDGLGDQRSFQILVRWDRAGLDFVAARGPDPLAVSYHWKLWTAVNPAVWQGRLATDLVPLTHWTSDMPPFRGQLGTQRVA